MSGHCGAGSVKVERITVSNLNQKRIFADVLTSHPSLGEKSSQATISKLEKYLHIYDSFATVKSCMTKGPIGDGTCLALCGLLELTHNFIVLEV